jgi:hypothetical protein
MIPSAMSRESEGLPSRNLIIKTSASREYFIFIETSASEIPLSKRKINGDYNRYLALILIDYSHHVCPSSKMGNIAVSVSLENLFRSKQRANNLSLSQFPPLRSFKSMKSQNDAPLKG